MNLMAMNMFLSEDNIKKHIEHYRTLRLKYSIMEKSFPTLSSKSIREVSVCNLSKGDRAEAVELLWQIKAHECYFNSFCEQPKRCDMLKKYYSSPERFIYELYSIAKDASSGFLFVYLDRSGCPRGALNDGKDSSFIRYEPILALDLWEHAYFSDYGFKKDKYIKSALTYFDLSRLNSLDN